MTLHYLDNSATTRPSAAALEAFCRVQREAFGNPSSKNALGFAAERELSAARRTVAEALGAEADEVLFLNSGSSANNLAVCGAARHPGKIIVTEGEHPSVYEAALAQKSRGFTVVTIPAPGGVLDLAALEAALDDTVRLVSVMMVGNETGTVNPVNEVAALVRRKAPRALFHIDAVQGFLKLRFSVGALGCDLLTVSAHKIHAPRGCAALYVKKGVTLTPLVYGGGQERALFSGTENVAAAAAFAAAIAEHDWEDIAHIAALADKTRTRLAALPHITVRIPPRHAPHIISLSVSGGKTEILLHLLEERGIIVSGGSACNAKKAVKSRALADFGATDEEIAGSLRVSFGRENTEEDAAALVAALEELCAKF